MFPPPQGPDHALPARHLARARCALGAAPPAAAAGGRRSEGAGHRPAHGPQVGCGWVPWCQGGWSRNVQQQCHGWCTCWSPGARLPHARPALGCPARHRFHFFNVTLPHSACGASASRPAAFQRWLTWRQAPAAAAAFIASQVRWDSTGLCLFMLPPMLQIMLRSRAHYVVERLQARTLPPNEALKQSTDSIDRPVVTPVRPVVQASTSQRQTARGAGCASSWAWAWAALAPSST